MKAYKPNVMKTPKNLHYPHILNKSVLKNNFEYIYSTLPVAPKASKHKHNKMISENSNRNQHFFGENREISNRI